MKYTIATVLPGAQYNSTVTCQSRAQFLAIAKLDQSLAVIGRKNLYSMHCKRRKTCKIHCWNLTTGYTWNIWNLTFALTRIYICSAQCWTWKYKEPCIFLITQEWRPQLGRERHFLYATCMLLISRRHCDTYRNSCEIRVFDAYNQSWGASDRCWTLTQGWSRFRVRYVVLQSVCRPHWPLYSGQRNF